MLPPPHIRIEDYDVSISPSASMLLNPVCPYDLLLTVQCNYWTFQNFERTL